MLRNSSVCCAGSGKKLLVGGKTITSSSSAREGKGGGALEGLGGWRDSNSSGWEEVSISFCNSSRLFRRKNPHWKHDKQKTPHWKYKNPHRKHDKQKTPHWECNKHNTHTGNAINRKRLEMRCTVLLSKLNKAREIQAGTQLCSA